MVVGIAGSISTEQTWSDTPAVLQVVPPSTLLKSPEPVPAYTVVGVTGAIARATVPWVRPVAVQVVPPSILLKTPRSAPAKTVAGVEGSLLTTWTDPISSEASAGAEADSMRNAQARIPGDASLPLMTTPPSNRINRLRID